MGRKTFCEFLNELEEYGTEPNQHHWVNGDPVEALEVLLRVVENLQAQIDKLKAV